MWSTTQDKNHDRLENRHLFDKLNNTYPNIYRGRAIFKKYISKKHERTGIKIYNLWDMTGQLRQWQLKIWQWKKFTKKAGGI
jgi:hypothetical protein